ncbi:MAG TPA: hypothetical protein VFO16_24125 [Pseudonocardiaceae bacterium]|nr:hypothetical protein [Pseudonocardiaceae bacterium]
MARRVDIEDVFRGEDVVLSCSLASPQNITGKTIKFALRKEQQPESPILAEATALIDDALVGHYHIPLPGVPVTDRAPNQYWYDIAMVDPGSYKVFNWGMFVIKPGARKV